MQPIVEKVWDDQSSGDWGELKEIPIGQHIIGIEVNTYNEASGLIHDMNFITGPLAPTSEF